MALNPYQLENSLYRKIKGKARKKGNKLVKSAMNRRERRKLRLNPEADPEYKKYNGWEF